MRRGHPAGMRLNSVLTLALVLSGSAIAAPQRYEMRSYVNAGGKMQPAFAWCDAPDRVLAVTQPAKVELITPQPVTLLQWPKPNSGQPQKAQYQLGPSEGAAGTIYTTLTPPGQMPNRAASQYFVSISNIENVVDPHYRMTHVNEFRTPEGSFRCRYVPQAAFMGATNKRTVIVWDNGKTATYATRNFDGTPGVYVTGGRKISNEELTAYEFKTRDGYRYRIEIVTPEYGGASSVQVYKGSQPVHDELMLAYSISRPAGQK